MTSRHQMATLSAADLASGSETSKSSLQKNGNDIKAARERIAIGSGRGLGFSPTSPEKRLVVPGAKLFTRFSLVASERPRSPPERELPIPDEYFGRSLREYRRWIGSMEQYFLAQPRHFSEAKNKVIFAATFLRGAVSSDWARYEANITLSAFTWNDFRDWLHDQVYSPQWRGWTAVIRFEKLHQLPNQSTTSFADVFLQYREEAVPEDMRNSDEYWARVFFAKLRPEIRQEIESGKNPPTGFQDLVLYASQIEKMHREPPDGPRSRKYQAGYEIQSARPPDSPLKRKAGGSPPHMTKKQRISEHKIQRKGGRCFCCNEIGHIEKFCPQKFCW